MKYIIGNWKMYLSPHESEKLARGLVLGYKLKAKSYQLVLCPSFDSLLTVGKIIKKSPFALGAQDVFWEEKGAYTGEESVGNLKEIGCQYIIVGHSERRHQLGETDEIVAKKFTAVLRAGLTPILCVGETAAELKSGKKKQVIQRQLTTALSLIGNCHPAGDHPKGEKLEIENLIVAYEPVWAIGTGTPETPEGARITHKFIREFLNKKFPEISKHIHIIYGGSVNSPNIAGFLRYSEIEGALVGGASTKLKEFVKIIQLTY